MVDWEEREAQLKSHQEALAVEFAKLIHQSKTIYEEFTEMQKRLTLAEGQISQIRAFCAIYKDDMVPKNSVIRILDGNL